MYKAIKLNIVFFSMVVLSVFFSGNSYAQPAEGSNLKPQPVYSTEEVIKKVISEIVQAVDKAFKSLGNQAFDDAGQTILWMLVAILIAWYAVRSFVGKGINAFLEEAITLFLLVGVIQLLLWSGGITAIESFISSLAASIAGESLADLPTTLNTILNKSFTATMRVLSMPSLKSDSGFSLGQLVTALPQSLAQYIAKFIAAGFIIVGACVYVANVILAYGMIIIAKALAPIMIPWLLIPQASFLFDGWLRFFLGACLVKVIGAFFIKLTNSWITGIVEVSQNVLLDANVDPYTLYIGNLLVYMAIALMAGLVAYLMIMIPGIASGLISGSSARTGFSGMSTLTSGLGGRGVMGGTKKSVSAPAQAAMALSKKLSK